MKPFIFLRIPRTASLSLHDAFAGLPNYNSLILDGRTSKSKYDTVTQAVDISTYTNSNEWKSSYIFSCVRNPFDRAVSIFHHNSWSSVGNFQEFCRLLSDNNYPSITAEQHAYPQTKILLKDGGILANYVLRFENLKSDFETLCSHIKLFNIKLPHRSNSINRSRQRKHYSEYYNNETREIVAEKYAKDIEYFGYEFAE